jgi:hypothetical protein
MPLSDLPGIPSWRIPQNTSTDHHQSQGGAAKCADPSDAGARRLTRFIRACYPA